VIPHARPIGALMIAVIEAAFGAGAMPAPGRPDRSAAGRRPTRPGAIRVTAVAGRADREGPATTPTGFLPERRVHDVGAAARFDWTSLENRGTREPTGSVRRSIEAVIEGLEYPLQALTSTRRCPTA
jgi:hypothetical protein